VVRKIRNKLVVLERDNEKSLTIDENTDEILQPNSVSRPVKEFFRDRRKYPRIRMDLPLEFRVKDDSNAQGAILIDASEGGFLIYSIEDIPIGTKLEITVLFSVEYELSKLEAFAEIIWKREDLGGAGYQYGLKSIQILGEDYKRLRELLSDLALRKWTHD
jgi:hypothetical protein